MISIHTDISGIIAQQNLANATKIMNQAIERMTTGYKINHAKDNAAGYAIVNNMTSNLNAYYVAGDNVTAGLDLVATANDTLSMMQDKASRLHALSTQARNGTYGASSLDAINSEASAIMSEIQRLYLSTQYNGTEIFNNVAYTIAPHLPTAETIGAGGTPMPVSKPEYNGFIDNPETYSATDIANMNKMSEVDELNDTISTGQYSISTVADLEKLAMMTNNGKITGGTFVLNADLDLGSIENWTPIGNDTYYFEGSFDGNGHVIKNLKINRPTGDYQGLFGYSEGEIKNIGIINCNVTGNYDVGGLAGYALNTITNSYATGNVVGNDGVGGLAGEAEDTITNSYATGNVTGNENVGGLAGFARNTITNSYATGNVVGYGRSVGGLAGYASGAITNSYATGNVVGNDGVGGLAGEAEDTITNSYATGNVTGNEEVGGLAGYARKTITNSYATGNVTGNEEVGGLAGEARRTITNSYATGNVTGNEEVGGLAGLVLATSETKAIEDSVSYSKVNGQDSATTGSLIGVVHNTSNNTSFGTVNITNCQAIAQDMDTIGGVYRTNGDPSTNPNTVINTGFSDVEFHNVVTKLQVGIYGDSSSQISFDMNFDLSLNLGAGIDSVGALNSINSFMTLLSDKQTELGAVQNRLESALDSIGVNIQNLTSSRSTLRDADIAKESARFVQQQILQEASATLLATTRNLRAENVLGLLQGLRR